MAKFVDIIGPFPVAAVEWWGDSCKFLAQIHQINSGRIRQNGVFFAINYSFF